MPACKRSFKKASGRGGSSIGRAGDAEVSGTYGDTTDGGVAPANDSGSVLAAVASFCTGGRGGGGKF